MVHAETVNHIERLGVLEKKDITQKWPQKFNKFMYISIGKRQEGEDYIDVCICVWKLKIYYDTHVEMMLKKSPVKFV